MQTTVILELQELAYSNELPFLTFEYQQLKKWFPSKASSADREAIPLLFWQKVPASCPSLQLKPTIENSTVMLLTYVVNMFWSFWRLKRGK